MYADAKRRDFQLLFVAGVSQKRIAELPGLSVRTIRQIGREPARLEVAAEPVMPPSAGHPQRVGSDRPSTFERYRDVVAAMLEESPKLKSLEVLRPLHRRQSGGPFRSALKAYVQSAAPVCDEAGNLSYGPNAASVLHRAINARCVQRRCILLATSKPLRD